MTHIDFLLKMDPNYYLNLKPDIGTNIDKQTSTGVPSPFESPVAGNATHPEVDNAMELKSSKDTGIASQNVLIASLLSNATEPATTQNTNERISYLHLTEDIMLPCVYHEKMPWTSMSFLQQILSETHESEFLEKTGRDYYVPYSTMTPGQFNALKRASECKGLALNEHDRLISVNDAARFCAHVKRKLRDEIGDKPSTYNAGWVKLGTNGAIVPYLMFLDENRCQTTDRKMQHTYIPLICLGENKSYLSNALVVQRELFFCQTQYVNAVFVKAGLKTRLHFIEELVPLSVVGKYIPMTYYTGRDGEVLADLRAFMLLSRPTRKPKALDKPRRTIHKPNRRKKRKVDFFSENAAKMVQSLPLSCTVSNAKVTSLITDSKPVSPSPAISDTVTTVMAESMPMTLNLSNSNVTTANTDSISVSTRANDNATTSVVESMAVSPNFSHNNEAAQKADSMTMALNLSDTHATTSMAKTKPVSLKLNDIKFKTLLPKPMSLTPNVNATNSTAIFVNFIPVSVEVNKGNVAMQPNVGYLEFGGGSAPMITANMAEPTSLAANINIPNSPTKKGNILRSMLVSPKVSDNKAPTIATEIAQSGPMSISVTNVNMPKTMAESIPVSTAVSNTNGTNLTADLIRPVAVNYKDSSMPMVTVELNAHESLQKSFEGNAVSSDNTKSSGDMLKTSDDDAYFSDNSSTLENAEPLNLTKNNSEAPGFHLDETKSLCNVLVDLPGLRIVQIPNDFQSLPDGEARERTKKPEKLLQNTVIHGSENVYLKQSALFTNDTFCTTGTSKELLTKLQEPQIERASSGQQGNPPHSKDVSALTVDKVSPKTILRDCNGKPESASLPSSNYSVQLLECVDDDDATGSKCNFNVTNVDNNLTNNRAASPSQPCTVEPTGSANMSIPVETAKDGGANFPNKKQFIKRWQQDPEASFDSVRKVTSSNGPSKMNALRETPYKACIVSEKHGNCNSDEVLLKQPSNPTAHSRDYSFSKLSEKVREGNITLRKSSREFTDRQHQVVQHQYQNDAMQNSNRVEDHFNDPTHQHSYRLQTPNAAQYSAVFFKFGEEKTPLICVNSEPFEKHDFAVPVEVASLLFNLCSSDLLLSAVATQLNIPLVALNAEQIFTLSNQLHQSVNTFSGDAILLSTLQEKFSKIKKFFAFRQYE